MNFDVDHHPLDEEAPGGLVINPHSELGKELRKWEQFPSDLTPRGTRPGNPYVFREYPKALYMARRLPNMQMACFLPAPHPYDFQRPEEFLQAVLFKESFDRSCYTTAANAEEERIKVSQGWEPTIDQAIQRHEQQQQAIGNAAAEVAHTAQGMTETAKRELKAADSQTHEHVTDVVPVRKHGKAAKGVVAKVGSAAVEES